MQVINVFGVSLNTVVMLWNEDTQPGFTSDCSDFQFLLFFTPSKHVVTTVDWTINYNQKHSKVKFKACDGKRIS